MAIVKLKLLPRSTLKAKVISSLPAHIEGGTAIEVSSGSGITTVSRTPRSQAPVSAAITAAANYGSSDTWYDGDWTQSAIAIEQIISTSPIQTGTLTTNATTAAGSAVLHFSSVPSWVGVGKNISYRALQASGTNIPAGAYVV